MSRKKFDKLPDFLIIGAGKSGTTSVDKYLYQHPQVFVSRLKEPNFFGYENITEADFGGNEEELAHFRISVTSLDKYLALFEDATPGQVIGETSNTYMYHEQAPERIKHYIPDVKLIAILRQPALRLYSRYLHLAREDRTPTREFADCLDQSTIWWQRNDLIREGFYYKNLKRYFELFPKENIRIYLYEDLQKKPLEVMADIYGFLGVDTSFQPDVSLRYNESGIIKNRTLNKIYGPGGLISKSLKAVLPGTLVHKLKDNSSLTRKVMEIRGKNLSKPAIDPELKRKLTFEVYGDDIRNLQTLIGRDLGHWLNV